MVADLVTCFFTSFFLFEDLLGRESAKANCVAKATHENDKRKAARILIGFFSALRRECKAPPKFYDEGRGLVEVIDSLNRRQNSYLVLRHRLGQ